MAEIDNNGMSLYIGSSATWSRDVPGTAPAIREISVKLPGRPTTRETPLTGPKKAADGRTHLYVIKSLHLVKVGLACGLYGRLSNIRTDNPHSPELVKYWEVPERVARRADILTRDLLLEFRHCGDWFAVTPERAIEAVEQMIDLCSSPPHP